MKIQNYSPASLAVTVAVILSFSSTQALAFKKKDADLMIEGASKVVKNLDSFCPGKKTRKIWIEGASTVYLKGTACETLDLHVEGSSTLCMTGTHVKHLKGVIEGASTLQVFAGFIEDDNKLSLKGSSTYNVNTAGSFICGAVGLITN